jgi:outer membrane protein TolC
MLSALLGTTLLLGGCASSNLADSLQQARRDTASFTQGNLQLAQTVAERAEQMERASKLLQNPLQQAEAVQLALHNSPALQAMLAEHWANQAQTAQAGSINNPLLQWSRLKTGGELSIERTLSFGLLDLLLLPKRQQVAQHRLQQQQLDLAAQVIQQVTQVRQAWVRAVAAQQSLAYARQVLASAEASAELARRMQAAGNFSKLMRVRQQVFYADAATQLANSQQYVTSTREELVRALGLDQQQADQLRLPERLPDLPATVRDAASVSQGFASGRLDIRMAQAALAASGQEQGLNWISSLSDVELGLRRDSAADSTSRGFEIGLRLPLFTLGQEQRAAMNAQTLMHANRLQATVNAASSQLRDSYASYRSSYDIARHYREEVVPLRKIILDENMLRYNGMLSSIFEVLADAREQIQSVIGAINAEQQFWLADAALQAAMVGAPVQTPSGNENTMTGSAQ